MHQSYPSVDNNGSYDVFVDADVVMVNQFFVVFCLLYTPFIIFSNVVVLCMLLLYPGFHEAFDNFLLNLAVSHLLVAAFCIPMYILSHLDYTRTALLGHKYNCLLWLSSVTLAGAGTIHCVFLIAADRFGAAAFPGAYRNAVTRQTSAVTIVIVWCYVFLLTFSPLLGCNRYRPDIAHVTRRCNVGAALPRGYVVLVSCVLNGAILAASCVLCLCASIISIRQQHKITQHRHGKPEHEITELQDLRDSIKITNFLVVLCLFLWLPSIILEPFRYYNVFTPKIYEIFNLVAQAIRFSSSVFSASVYSICKTEYREVMGLMFHTLPWRWKSEMDLLYLRHVQSYTVNRTRSLFSGSSLISSISCPCSDESETAEYIFSKFEESESLKKLSLYSAIKRSKSALRLGKFHKHDKEITLAVLMMNNKLNTESDTYLTLRQLVAKRGTCVDHMSGIVPVRSPHMIKSQPEVGRVKIGTELDAGADVDPVDMGEVASRKGAGLVKSGTHLPVTKTSSSAVDRRLSFTRRPSQYTRRMSVFATEITPRRVSDEELEDVESTVDPLHFEEDDSWFFKEKESVFHSTSAESLQEALDRFTDLGSEPLQ